MEQFSLEKWLENPSRKIVTRTGESVEILNYEVKGKYCIYAKATWQDGEIFNICTTSNGEAYEGEETAYDLFFADEEEKLTDFEKAVEKTMPYKIPIYMLKSTSQQLLELARKEIERKNIIVDKDKYLRNCDYYYEHGKQDALKDFPKWKKITDETNLSLTISNGEYYLTAEDLESIPKEE